jgi:hypothetical protein
MPFLLWGLSPGPETRRMPAAGIFFSAVETFHVFYLPGARDPSSKRMQIYASRTIPGPAFSLYQPAGSGEDSLYEDEPYRV